jgi:hypothetical protein
VTYKWQELGLSFELQSNDADTLLRARTILSPGSHDPGRPPDRRWTIDRVSDECFRVTGGSIESSLIPLNVPTGDAGLLRVEYDMVGYVMERLTSPAVHGALLSRDGKGVLIVGPSLAGKSTLAVGMWRAGWSLLSDDVAILDPREGIAFPAPRRVSLRLGARDIVGDDLWNRIAALPSCAKTHKGLFFHPSELDSSRRIQRTALSAIVFLARRGVESAPAAVTRLNPAAAVVALVPYAFRVREGPLPEALATLSPLVAGIPVFDVGRGPLSQMIASVESQLA